MSSIEALRQSIFKTADKVIEINVQFKQDTVWLTQAQMAELFDKDRDPISEHIVNVFKEINSFSN